MSWETRKRGGIYYCRNRRRNGRQVREYCGAGEAAVNAAEQDRIAREAREAKWAVRRQEQQRIAAQDAEIARVHAAVDLLARAELLHAGFYNHNGNWRRRRR